MTKRKVLIKRMLVSANQQIYPTYTELRVHVDTDKEEYSVSEVVNTDDLESRFDYIFDKLRDYARAILIEKEGR